MIKVKGTARNGGFNSIQPGASDSVQNGFAPPLEVIGGTDGCYIKQFQLDQFLDHLTVIIKCENKECQTTRRYISLNKKTKRQLGMVKSVAASRFLTVKKS